MGKLVSFVERTRVASALMLAFLISFAWVSALALLLRTAPTHSVQRRVETSAAAYGAAGADRLALEIETPAIPFGESRNPVGGTSTQVASLAKSQAL
jgi:hypothetical protein